MNRGLPALPAVGGRRAEGATTSTQGESVTGRRVGRSRLPLPLRTGSRLSGVGGTVRADRSPAGVHRRPRHRLPTLHNVVINSPTYTDLRPAVPLPRRIASRCRIPKPVKTRWIAGSTPSTSTLDSSLAPPSVSSRSGPRAHVSVGNTLPVARTNAARGTSKKRPTSEGERRLFSGPTRNSGGGHICSKCGGPSRVVCEGCTAAPKLLPPSKQKRSLMMPLSGANRVQRMKTSAVRQVAVEAFESGLTMLQSNLPSSNAPTDDGAVGNASASGGNRELSDEDRLNAATASVPPKARHTIIPRCRPNSLPSRDTTSSTRARQNGVRLASASYTVPDRRQTITSDRSENSADREVGSTAAGNRSGRSPSPVKRARTTPIEKWHVVRPAAKSPTASPVRDNLAQRWRPEHEGTFRQNSRKTRLPSATVSRTNSEPAKFVTLSGREAPIDFAFGSRRRSLPSVTFTDENGAQAASSKRQPVAGDSSKKPVVAGRKVKRRLPWRDVVTILPDSPSANRRECPSAAEAAGDSFEKQPRQERENVPTSELLSTEQGAVALEECRRSEQSTCNINTSQAVTHSVEFSKQMNSSDSEYPSVSEHMSLSWNVSKNSIGEQDELGQESACGSEASTSSFVGIAARPPASFWLELGDPRRKKAAGDAKGSAIFEENERGLDSAHVADAAPIPSFFSGETQPEGFRLDELRRKKAAKPVHTFISLSGKGVQATPARQKQVADSLFTRRTPSTGLTNHSKTSTAASDNESAAASNHRSIQQVSPSRSYSARDNRSPEHIQKQLAETKALIDKLAESKSDSLTASQDIAEDGSRNNNEQTESNEINGNCEVPMTAAAGCTSPIDETTTYSDSTPTNAQYAKIQDSVVDATTKYDEIPPLQLSHSPQLHQPDVMPDELPIRYGKGGYAYNFEFVRPKASGSKSSRIPQPKVVDKENSSPARSRSYVVGNRRKPVKPSTDNSKKVQHLERRSTVDSPLVRTVDSLTLIDRRLVDSVPSSSTETRVLETDSRSVMPEDTATVDMDLPRYPECRRSTVSSPLSRTVDSLTLLNRNLGAPVPSSSAETRVLDTDSRTAVAEHSLSVDVDATVRAEYRTSTVGNPLLRTVDSLILLGRNLGDPVPSWSAETHVLETDSCTVMPEDTSPVDGDLPRYPECRRSPVGSPSLRTEGSFVDRRVVDPVPSWSAETHVRETVCSSAMPEHTSPVDVDAQKRAEYLCRRHQGQHIGSSVPLKDDVTDQSSGYVSLTTFSIDKISNSTAVAGSVDNDQAHPSSVLEASSSVVTRGRAADDNPEVQPRSLTVAVPSDPAMSAEPYFEELSADAQISQLQSSSVQTSAVTPETSIDVIFLIDSVRQVAPNDLDVFGQQLRTSKKSSSKKSPKVVGRISLDLELRPHSFDEASVELTGIEWSRLQGREIRSPETMRSCRSVFEAIVLRNAVRPAALAAAGVSPIPAAAAAALPGRLLAVAQLRRQAFRSPSALVIDVARSRFDRGVQSTESTLQRSASEKFRRKDVVATTSTSTERNYIRSKRYLEQCAIALSSSVQQRNENAIGPVGAERNEQRIARKRRQLEDLPITDRSNDVGLGGARKHEQERPEKYEARKQSPSKIKKRMTSSSHFTAPPSSDAVRSKIHSGMVDSFDHQQHAAIPLSDNDTRADREAEASRLMIRDFSSPVGSPRRRRQNVVDLLSNGGMTEHRRAAGEPCWRTDDDLDVDHPAFASRETRALPAADAARVLGRSHLQASRGSAVARKETTPSFIKYIPVPYESLLTGTAPVIAHDQIDRSEWIRTQLAVDAERRRLTAGSTGSGLHRARSDPSLASLGSAGDRSQSTEDDEEVEEDIDWTAVSPEVEAFCRSRRSNNWRHANERLEQVMSTAELLKSVDERRFDPVLNEWHCRLNGTLLFQPPAQRPVFCAQLYAEIPPGPINLTIYNLKVELACTALRTFFEPCAQVQFVYVKSMHDKLKDVIGSGSYEAMFASQPLRPAGYDAVLALSRDAGGLLRHSSTGCVRSVADLLQVVPDRLLVVARCCDKHKQTGRGGPAPPPIAALQA